MFKSIRRLHFLKGVSNDGIIFSSGSSNWIQIFRKCSGLMEKKEDLGEVADDLSFTAFLHQRQQEAKRSIIIQISNQELWDKINKECHDCGYVKNVFHYTEKDTPFVLIEMASEDKLSEFLKENNGIQSGSGINNQFLKLKESETAEKASAKNRTFDVNSRVPAAGNMLKLVSNTEDHVTKSLSKIYTDLSLNDLGVRLRFLMCRQMETFCSGFLPNAIAYPFGSSTTGFGVNGCDLDIALVPLPVCNSSFQQENFLFMHKITVQEHITVTAELMKLFLVGCSGLTLIRNAKVPIVKYRNSFTNVECDLSLYNLHGVVMSQLLYTMSLIDCRVRPLVIALKLWAYNSGLVNKIPGRTISNFQLSLLAIFFLQYTNLLPPGSNFPCNDGFLFDDKNFMPTLNQYKLKAKEDTRSLGELYYSFFKFYAGFDFKKNGICVRSGKIIKNSRKSPLYIENPLLKGLNVSTNVDNDEVQKLHYTINAMSSKILKADSSLNLQNVIQKDRI